jgi:AraC-like DNA-binding protein
MYNLTLAEFAKLTHHSLTSFKTEFSEIFQSSPGKWLIQKRLDLACDFLTSTQKTVREISAESGFESVTHFNRIFKERQGITPLKYREQIQS